MKPFDDKWVSTLKNIAENLPKRYKAFINIRKYCRENEDTSKYKQIINDNSRHIFQIITDKMARVPTSAIEKLVTLTSSTQLVNEILEIMNDIFTLTDSTGLKELIHTYRVKIVVILWKFLEPTTKREMKKTAFNFLLKILDTFEDINNAEKEYIALFNTAIDSIVLRESSQRPSYYFILNPEAQLGITMHTYNEYQQNLNAFHELSKNISDSNYSNKYEDVLKDIFSIFVIFLKERTSKPNKWFLFFQKTWMDIYFNEKTPDETIKFGVFEAVVKKGFTTNLVLLKQFLHFVEGLMREQPFLMSTEDLFMIMEKLKYLYWNIKLHSEIDQILKIYLDFVTKKLKFRVDNYNEGEIIKRVIGSLDEMLVRDVIQGVLQVPLEKEDYIIVGGLNEQDNIALKIFHELINTYGTQYSKDIYSTMVFALKKSNSQGEDTMSESVYQLVEIVLILALKETSSVREEYMKTLEIYFSKEKILLKVVDFMKKKILSFINESTSESRNEVIKNMEIHSGTNIYPMKVEYIPQLLLQEFCNKLRDKGFKEYEYFETTLNGGKLLKVLYKPGVNYEECQKLLAPLEHSFDEWMNCLVIFYQIQFLQKKQTFNIFCKGLTNIIEFLVTPDSTIGSNERAKGPIAPKYPMPTETLYEIFGFYFTQILKMKDTATIEAKLWATKAYLAVFCNTQSEIPLNKSIISEIIQFIYHEFNLNKIEEDSVECFMTNCVILTCTEELFLTDFPTIKILIPLYLKTIEYILVTTKYQELEKDKRQILERVLLQSDSPHEGHKKISIYVMNSAIKMLKSILFMGYSIPEMKIIPLPVNSFEKGGTKHSQEMEIIRDYGISITYKLLDKMKTLKEINSTDFISSEFMEIEFQHNLFTTALLVINLECNPKTRPRKHILSIDVQDFIDVFLHQFTPDIEEISTDIANFHAQILGALASLVDNKMKFYPKILKKTVAILISALRKMHKASPTPQQKETIAEMLYVLCRWVLNDSGGILLGEEVLADLIDMMVLYAKYSDYRDFFEAFFNNILLHYLNFPLKNQGRDNKRSIFEETSFKHLNSKHATYFEKSRELLSMKSFSSPIREELNEEDNSPDNHKSKNIKYFKSQSSHGPNDGYTEVQELKITEESKPKREDYLNTFSYLNIPKEDIKHLLVMKETELVDSMNMLLNNHNPDSQESDVMYFSHMDNALFSFVGQSEKYVGGKSIFRNMTGRFAWEFTHLKSLNHSCKQDGPKKLESILKHQFIVRTSGPFNDSKQERSDRSKSKELTLVSNGIEEETRRDIFKELFEYIKENALEMKEFNFEGPIRIKRLTRQDLFEENYEKAKDFEEKRIKSSKNNLTQEMLRKKDLLEMAQQSITFDLTKNTLKMSHKDGIRLLFSNLGLLSQFKGLDLSVFENDKNTKHLFTTVSLLDVAFARETIKIGVVYVARGQDNQRDILRNTKGSPAYEEFIKALGDRISLKTHLGFQAGLKYKTDGEETIYSSDALTEITFHVATLMPTENDDDQVLNKKRHIGNDPVNIVWCENYRFYRRNTISSQYNFVQIVIYPMKFNLFKVVIQKKENIGILFPWTNNMIVNKENLPTLVKLCAISAFRKSRPQKEPPFKSYQKRNDYIKQLGSPNPTNLAQFKRKIDQKDVLSSLFVSEATN